MPCLLGAGSALAQVAVDSQGPDCLTQKAHKTFDRISWEIADESDGDDDDDDGDDGDEHKSPVKEEQDYSNSVRGWRLLLLTTAVHVCPAGEGFD